MLWLTKTRMTTTTILTPRILLQAFAHNTKVLEEIIHFIYLWFIFQHCQCQYLELLVPHEKMMDWKVERNSHGKIATWLATASRDWGQPQKSQFRILFALAETSTQVPPEYKPQTYRRSNLIGLHASAAAEAPLMSLFQVLCHKEGTPTLHNTKT